MSERKALITGITGQDGSYLAEFLLQKGYEIHGIVRRRGLSHLDRVCHLIDKIHLHHGDLSDKNSVMRITDEVRPREIYNLAAQSFVPVSWSRPILTGDVTGLGATRLLNAIRQIDPSIRFCQAGSSEMFGAVAESPQRETTPFCPRNPYGAAKVYAHYVTATYRASCGLYACSAILFNHESPRRGPEFVTRKITHRVAQIRLGIANELRLGNLDAKRDWGFAGDYMKAMWLMLQQDYPSDFVIGSGKAHTVREFVQIAFDQVGLDWKKYVVVDPKYYRPKEAVVLLADASNAKSQLGWEPETSFEQLVRHMVDEDLRLLGGGQIARAG